MMNCLIDFSSVIAWAESLWVPFMVAAVGVAFYILRLALAGGSEEKVLLWVKVSACLCAVAAALLILGMFNAR